MAERSYGSAVCACGNEFERYHARHVRCSPRCKGQAKQAAKRCPGCGGPLPPLAKTWCSANCQRTQMNADRSARNAEGRGIRVCVCGKPFAPLRSDRYYCSKTCKNRSWARRNPEAMEVYASRPVRGMSRAEYDRAWKAADPARKVAGRLKEGRRRARLRGCRTFVLSRRDVRRLVEGPCLYCGGRGVMHQDHVLPISSGYATHGVGNLAPACGTCNTSKGGRLLVAWRHRSQRGRTLGPLHGSGPTGPLP